MKQVSMDMAQYKILYLSKRQGFKKAFVCTDPDLVKFKVVNKVLDLLYRSWFRIHTLR